MRWQVFNIRIRQINLLILDFCRGIFTDPFQFFQYLGVLQGVWRGVVGGRGGEGVLVAVPAHCHEEFGKGNTFHKYHVIYIQKYQSAWLAGTPCPWEDEEGEVARM